jgi:hypothetical protein
MPEQTKSITGWAGKLGALWCAAMHDSPMWPIRGEYRCRACGRRYPVLWESVVEDARPQRLVPSLRPAVLPLALLLALLSVPAVRGADSAIVESNNPAALAFARYIAGPEEMRPWSTETVQIDASIPRLQKQGRLSAVRRLLPFGKPQYQVLESGGDDTVKRRVIYRYLSAEEQASEIPSSAVAITPANYKFHYRGEAKTGDKVAYVFQITPRKKHEGLIKGELWLDGETGVAVRESGRLVKSPSIFLKHVDVIKEIVLADRNAQERITHLKVDTRLVGVAELTIRERPYDDSGAADSLSGER